MTENSHERWLVLDDNAFDRRRLVMALESQRGSLDLILMSTVSEVQDYLAKHEVQVCLFDFFLRGTTTEKLIADVRYHNCRSHPPFLVPKENFDSFFSLNLVS